MKLIRFAFRGSRRVDVTMTLSLLGAAIVLGLMGAGHCATMCGPTTIALVSRTPNTPQQPWAAHLGRLMTYATLGALAAWITAGTTRFLRNEVLQTAWFLVPNVLLLLSALYLMGFRQAYAPIENVGRRAWKSLDPARAYATKHTGFIGDLLRGAVWGMLPCGMVYSALGVAVLAINPVEAAMVMIAFGASTLPVLLAIGALSKTTLARLQTTKTRRALGAALLLLALWNVYLVPARVQGAALPFLC
jgi:uncharacterized protein